MKSKPATMDASQTAVRIVSETIPRHSEPLPAELEAAWAARSTPAMAAGLTSRVVQIEEIGALMDAPVAQN